MTFRISLRAFSCLVLLSFLGGFLSSHSASACHVAARLHYEQAPPEERAKRAHELAAPWLETQVEMDMHSISYRLKAAVSCQDGMADGFPCKAVDLLAHMPLSAIGGVGSSDRGNDSWGWTDGTTGREYALVGRRTGTSFIDITDPESPVYLGDLPTHSDNSPWRDIKVYQDHAFIVADFVDGHGMQVFDLTKLRNVVNPPATFAEDAHYDAFNRAHNLVINEATGFAYAVGSEVCAGGLHMIDITTPTSPSFAGCFDDDAYTHDAQCVIYQGPDEEHQGKEICFASNEDTLTIVDVTDKLNPSEIAKGVYSGWGYTHQGWLSEDHALFYLDDERDESDFDHNTRTYVWDMSDLDTPTVVKIHDSDFPATDHNQYVKDGRIYQANYSIGLRILEHDRNTDEIEEVAFFDSFPENNTSTAGAWSVFPFFDSGTVILSDINRGLFVLKPRLETEPPLFEDDFESGDALRWDGSFSGGNMPVSAPAVGRTADPENPVASVSASAPGTD